MLAAGANRPMGLQFPDVAMHTVVVVVGNTINNLQTAIAY